MPRLAVTKILEKAFTQKISLTSLLKDRETALKDKDKPLVQALCYGVARWYYRLTFIVDSLLKKPLRGKDIDIYLLMLLGVYQILFTRIPTYAAIYETVKAARELKKEWATKLINGVLRNFLKQQGEILTTLMSNEQAFYAHPKWLIDKLKKTCPSWKATLDANNLPPLFCLRVNQQKMSRQEYLATLANSGIDAKIIPYTTAGIILKKPIDVSLLPLFQAGAVSVQDGAAQLAADILNPQENDRILDACAAPGGKTAHLLEKQPKINELVALDKDKDRIKKITENLNRLGLEATTVCQDATSLSFWDGVPFDKILLDVPCSATGVIRRYPDIKVLREESDIISLSALQFNILETTWKTLKPGGLLLFVTCSVIPEENQAIIKKFLTSTPDSGEVEIVGNWGIKTSIGRQIFPGMHEGMDGFYFAKLQKRVI